jgi:hypothetical protein
MGAKFADGVFLSAGAHPELFRAVADGFSRAGPPGLPAGTAPSRYTVALYLSPADVWDLAPVSDDEVVASHAGKRSLFHAPELVRALAALRGLVIVFDGTALQKLQANLGDGWERKDETSRAEWVNDPSGLRLSAWSWPNVQVDEAGNWRLADQYDWTGVRDPAPLAVPGSGRSYPAVRFHPIMDGTGGGFWGTWPWQVDVVGRSGGLSLMCNSTVWSEEKAKRDAGQALVDQRCSGLLERFTVDLGEPLVPLWAPEPVPAGGAAIERLDGGGWRLVFAAGPYPQWEGRRTLRQWQISVGKGEWLVDLERGEVRPAPLPWPADFQRGARPYALADGRLVGVVGAAFVLQDSAGEKQVELGTAAGGVTVIAPAGDAALAYTRSSGPLWQLDWGGGEQHPVADSGWPVGVLADGRAVAIRGGRVGELVAWRAAAPDAVASISPGGVQTYGATISPDGRRVVWFQAEPGSASDYPRVTALAVYDAATGRTDVKPLPRTAYVDRAAWDGSGNLTFHFWDEILQLRPSGELVNVAPPSDIGFFRGWDGCGMLVIRNSDDGLYRYSPPGCPDPSGAAGGVIRLARQRDVVDGVGLMGFPRGTAMEILDIRTGKRYRAAGLGLPQLPMPPWLQFGPLDPESGYVALQVRQFPQVVYQIAPVTPVTGTGGR